MPAETVARQDRKVLPLMIDLCTICFCNLSTGHAQSRKKQVKKRISRSLRLDRQFVPVSVDDGDEFFPNGIFTFNITKMILFINSHRVDFAPEPVAVRDHAGSRSSLSQAVLDSLHNTEPVILAEIAPGRYNLIDGNHRMEKARRAGLEHVMAYKVRMEQHIRFLTTHEGYLAFVEYWNGKLKDIYDDGI